jgi:hypothetical protein
MRVVRGSVEVGIFPLIALLAPSVVLANVGTPLMWAGPIRLVCVNLVIGVGEGFFIWLFLRTRFWKTLGIMILANYASWFVGEVVLLPFLAQAGKGILGDQPLYHVWEFMWYVLAAAFGLTVVFEWPFCFWVLRQKRYRIIKSIVAVLVVNVASYAFLVHFYLGLSGTTVLTKLKQDPSLSFAANPKAWVYFIAINEGGLCRIRVDGSEPQQILSFQEIVNCGYEKTKRNPVSSITLELRSSEQSDYWDLCFWVEKPQRAKRLLNAFTEKSRTPVSQENSVSSNPNQMAELPPAKTDYRPIDSLYPTSSSWKVHVGGWAFEGLTAIKDNLTKQYAIELPFMTWFSRYPTVIGNQVVYQLGDQIVLLDLEKDLIGVIARGYSPVVVLDEDAGTKGQAIEN